ncbi:MAG TPA: HAMP domain-containing sensor histidine kinase [Stellaceae bacterium]|nr:HAMP domain-containing sensor histidine kinase [Stellaceae bacterium]
MHALTKPLPLQSEHDRRGKRAAEKPARSGGSDLLAQIRREQVGYLQRGLVVSFLVHPLVAALVAVATLDHAAHRMIAVWLLSVWALAAVRAVYWHRRRNRLGSAAEAARAGVLLAAVAGASNFVWGAAPLLIWPAGTTGPQVLLFVAIAAATAIEMVTLASFLLAAIGSLSISLLALLIALLWHGLLTPLILCALLLFGSVMAIATYHINRLLFESLRLRFELAAASTAAQAASRSKSDFIANVSHELRTPLNAIIGFSEMIKGQVLGANSWPRYVEYASHIHGSGLHLLEIINDILDLSKIEAGHLELKDERIELGEVVRTSLILVTDRAEEAGVTIGASVPDPSPVIRGDERAIKQALLNLLSNAVKFTPIGGSIHVNVRRDPTGGIVVTVTDTGIGMSPADIPKAMQPFEQLGDVHTRSRPGTGLGLPIVRSLVEMHEGKFSLVSELGVGTSAEISFPVRRVVAA